MIVYGVHAIRADEIRAVEVIFSELPQAEEHAAAVSTDPGTLAGAVTRFHVDELGRRTPVALFVGGERQQVAHVSDDRTVAANGYLTHPSVRRRSRARP